ncbi:MAG TPA: diguanylate cyclase [Pengzhenrongella sp.]|jgi:diguanylate cyclase (GGDEF)-like protein/PAS domain S-box-containing protein
MNARMLLAGLQASGPLPARSRSPVAVLVVDDNYAKRLALRSVLLPLGFAIVEADSGLAALRCVMAQNFAVILLDVRMPIMDGFETAALIRRRQQAEMTPIIFVTANVTDELEHLDRYAQGAVDFMFAPVSPHELRAKVSVFVNLFWRAEELAERAREVEATVAQLRLLTDAAPIGIFQTDAENRYVYTNPRWSEITGLSHSEVAGQDWDCMFGEQQRADLIAELLDSAARETEFFHRLEIRPPRGPVRIVVVTSKPISDGADGITGWVGTLADVTAEARAEAAMSHARTELEQRNAELAATARRDPLTGLSNRRALQEDLERLELRVFRHGQRYCIALIDLDHFRSFNDTYGHQAGDDGLRAVADHLRSSIRSGDVLYRYGGESFLCLFADQSRAQATATLGRMRTGVANLAIPHSSNPEGVLTVSAGLAVLDPGHSRSVARVIKEADEALLLAKKLGRDRVEQLGGGAPALGPEAA